MSLTDVNWLAIIASAVIVMALGFLWYGPLFGKQWATAMGWQSLSADEVKAKQAEATPGYIASVIGALLTAYALSVLLTGVADRSWMNGAGLGALVWLGMMAPPALTGAIFQDTDKNVFWLNTGYQLLYMLVLGAMLAVWI
jgi:hypothetical protein